MFNAACSKFSLLKEMKISPSVIESIAVDGSLSVVSFY